MAANGEEALRGPLLGVRVDDGTVWRDWDVPPRGRRSSSRPWTALAIAAALLALAGVVLLLSSGGRPGPGPGVVSRGPGPAGAAARQSPHEVESGVGAAAADDARCSEVGAAALRAGGHAVDAAVAAALCLGVVHPMSSGLGGGAFVVVRDAASGDAVAFDARETAPAAATTVRTRVRSALRSPHIAPTLLRCSPWIVELVGTQGREGGSSSRLASKERDAALRPVQVHDMWGRMTPGQQQLGAWVVRVSLSGGPGTLTLVIGAHTAHSHAKLRRPLKRPAPAFCFR
jgi:hypothetical protein